MKGFFKDKKVAREYDACFGVDKIISIPGMYTGALSEITPQVAEHLIRMQDNQIVRKGSAPTETPAAPPEIAE
jgi:hypothetical protein